MGVLCSLLKKVQTAFEPVKLPQGRWTSLFELQTAYSGYLESKQPWTSSVKHALHNPPYAVNYTHGVREVGEVLVGDEIFRSSTPLLQHIRLFAPFPKA